MRTARNSPAAQPAASRHRRLPVAAGAESCTLAWATPAHLDQIDQIRRRDSSALGFLSRAALAEKVRLGQVRVAVAGGRLAGFLLHGSMRQPEVRVFQLAVDPAFRGRGIARTLVGDLLHRAGAAGALGLSLRCREELAANKFWHHAGFQLHGLEPARHGALFVWVRRVGSQRVAPNKANSPASEAAKRLAPNKANSGMHSQPTTVAPQVLAPNKANSEMQSPATTFAPQALAPNKANSATHSKAVTSELQIRAPNKANSGAPVPDEHFRFHSRWHPCPTCGRLTCDTWSAGARRRRLCVACTAGG